MEQNRNGAFRPKKVYFTQVSNNALRDNSLSLKAKGLYALIQSYITKEDFTLYKNYLKKQCKEGEKAFENTWKELKENGYLIQYRLQDSQTKQFYYEYDLLDNQDIELSNKVHASQNRKKHEEKSHNPKKEGMVKKQKAIPTKRDGMANGYDGIGGGYNNTNINNTNINNTNISSSSILQHFNNSICELRKTTTIKFLEYAAKYDEEFIFTIINYCEEVSIKSFAGFKKVIDSYIEKNILTKEDFIKDVEAYRANKNKSKKPYTKKTYFNKNKVDSFNNYEQRSYDFNEFEKVLHGESDKSLSECIKGNNINKSDGSSPVLDELKKLDLA